MKNCTGIFCPMQYGKVDPATCQAVDYCSYATPPKTKADRIRAMTDEELAWELARICRMPFYKDDSEIDEYEVDCWANWLKQEVEPDADL